MSARDEVLERIRAALAGTPAPAVPRGYRVHGTLSQADVLALFDQRTADYRATVRRTSLAATAEVVAQLLADHDVRRVGVPAGLDRAVLPADLDVLVDSPSVGVTELDTLDAAVTGCAVAVAETGTFVLDGSPDQGRRALTLVPDVHLVLVRATQVVQTVPQAVSRLDPRRPLTWVSGPSATSDIELQRVEGVHGPRTLLVVLVDDA